MRDGRQHAVRLILTPAQSRVRGGEHHIERRLSPIDLIPDFIPILGYLDDLVIVPLGILLAVKLVPAGLMQEFRTAAASAEGERMLGRWGAAIIVILWLAGITLATMWLRSLMTT
jgi:Protein of unknown function (DUF1232)